MGQFNGGAPDVVGFEPRWAGQYSVTLTDGIAVLQRVKPGAATIRKVHHYIQNAGGSNPGLAVEWLSGEPMPLQSVLESYPGADVTTTGWEDFTTATTNLWQDVDDRYDVSDGIQNNGAIGPNERRAALFRGTASAITGKRILALVVTINAGLGQFVNMPFAKVRGLLEIGGQRYPGGDYLWKNDAQWYQPPFVAGWLRNPATNKPWTLAAVNAILATGSTDRFGFDVTPGKSGSYTQINDNAFHCSGVVVGVLYADENRAGTTGQGSKYVTNTPRTGWDAYQYDTDVTTSADTYYWMFLSAFGAASVATGSSLIVPRFNDDHGTVAVAASAAATVGEHRQLLAAAVSSGAVSGTIPARDRPITDGMVGSIPFLLETSAGAILDASQPYAQLNRADIHTSSAANRGQKVTPASIANYGAILATVGWASFNAPDQPLVIEARSAINGGSLLATATLEADPNDTWVRDRYLIFDTPVTTAIGTAVYLHVRSSAGASRAWRILQYDTRSDNIKSGSGTSAAQVEGTTMGGTTDGYFTAGALATRYDLAIALIQNPPNPAVTVTSHDAL